MLKRAKTWEELCAAFRSGSPARLNMAQQVCGHWAARAPDRVAIIDHADGPVTYAALEAMAGRLANALLALGITRGDRVGVLRSQSPWTAAAHIAVWKLGAISIPLFKLFEQGALASRVSDAGAKVIITDRAGASVCAALHVAPLVPEDMPNATSAPVPCADTGPDDPAVLMYTSGTTGPPKGALHAHRVLLGHLPGVEVSHDFLGQPGDVLWTPADWAWIGGLFDVLMPGLALGVPVVAARMAKFDPRDAAAIIARHKVRNVFFPPTALRMLKAADVKIPGLRSVASGGEPLGAEMLDWGRRAFGTTINEFYGQTECNMVASSCAKMFAPKPGAIGRAVPGVRLGVIDAQGDETVDEGDIAVHQGAASMMLEYWKRPEATAEKFRGAWMLTGDRGIWEGEYLRFVGREDDVITSSGYRIGPSEIEDCLLRHPAVATVGVVGKPDALRTEVVKAFVVLKPGTAPSAQLAGDLQSHVKTHLAKHCYPREVAFVPALPMTVTGKVIRAKLRESQT